VGRFDTGKKNWNNLPTALLRSPTTFGEKEKLCSLERSQLDNTSKDGRGKPGRAASNSSSAAF